MRAAAAALGACLAAAGLAASLSHCSRPESGYLEPLEQMESSGTPGRRGTGELPESRVEELKKAIARYQREVERTVAAKGQIGVYQKMLALRYMERGMYGAAYDSFAEAIRIYPENRILFYYSGVCAARMSQAAVDDESRSLWLERADKLYRRAADLDPRYADALYARAVLLAYELDRPAEAAVLARRVLEIEAKNVEAMFLLGGLYYRLGRLEDALAVYQEVEKLTTVPERRAEALANQQQIREELYGTDEILALAISRASLLRPREKLLLLGACDGPAALERTDTAALSGLLGRPIRGGSWRPRDDLRWAERARGDLTRAGFVCTFYWERSFPSLLREIYDPPVVLFWRGRLPAPECDLVAIVGTRRPTGAAREKAYQLGLELGRAGIGTVSGLARGIDAEAQRGTVDGGGYTIGVLGNGIDAVCPSSSRVLARAILSRGGAIASEYPPGTPPVAHNFPARNRIISALARSVVVVQAPARSGALITAEYALEHNRDLAVHAVGLCGEVGRGSRELWQQGAAVVRSASDVLGLWGPRAEPNKSTA